MTDSNEITNKSATFLGIEEAVIKKWVGRIAIGALFGVAAFMSFASMGIAPIGVAIIAGVISMGSTILSQTLGAFPKSKTGKALLIGLVAASVVVSLLTFAGAIPALSAAFTVTKDTSHMGWVPHHSVMYGYEYSWKTWDLITSSGAIFTISQGAIVGITALTGLAMSLIGAGIRGAEIAVNECFPQKPVSAEAGDSAAPAASQLAGESTFSKVKGAIKGKGKSKKVAVEADSAGYTSVLTPSSKLAKGKSFVLSAKDASKRLANMGRDNLGLGL